MNAKMFRVIALTTFILCSVSCDHAPQKSASPKSIRPFGGEEWISWTPAERNRYVFGYISGYRVGFHESCIDAEAQGLFNEHLKPVPDEKDVVNIPGYRCNSNRREYSKASLSEDGLVVRPYVDTITKMYEEHPDSRSAAYQLLMELLADGQATTADQLYKTQQNKWPNARIE